MTVKRIIVTGGSGMAGQWIVKHFHEAGYEVVNVDACPPAEPIGHFIQCDLTDLGQVVSAFSPFNTYNRGDYVGVVHMGAIPRPHNNANNEVFRINTMSTYNVLEACTLLGIRKAVIASSESSYGICFADQFFEPQYLPVDEDHPQLPEDSYGLSKVVNEATAEAFHRRTGMQIISFRLGNILRPEDHETIRANFDRPEDRLRILWSYIDTRDVANACQLAIEKDGLGCQHLILAADDSSSNIPSKDLISKFLPGVKDFKETIDGRKSLISNAKIKEVLGWKQAHYLEVE